MEMRMKVHLQIHAIVNTNVHANANAQANAHVHVNAHVHANAHASAHVNVIAHANASNNQCAHAPGREGEGRGKGGACICTPNDLHSRVGLDARGCLDQPARHNPWVPMHMRVHVWGAGAAVGAAGASERRPVGRRKTARFRRLQLLPR